MSQASPHDAWNTYWERQNRAGSRGGSDMPANWQGLDRVRAEVWKRFAATLPRSGRVLDLATGEGLVLAHMHGARRDLKLEGIDRAKVLPKPPRGTKLRGGISMEKLPFPDRQFAAVTSQFGFEYGDIGAAAKETARVLQAGGAFALMSHRIDGPIVAHNRKRREQIAWALEEQQLLKLAHNSLGLRSAGIAALPQPVIAAPELGAQRFGAGSAAWEIAEAIRQTLHLGRQDSAQQVAAVLDDIGRQAQNELGRIASLELAAQAAADRENLIGTLAEAGLALESENALTASLSPSPFADFRVFRA